MQFSHEAYSLPRSAYLTCLLLYFLIRGPNCFICLHLEPRILKPTPPSILLVALCCPHLPQVHTNCSGPQVLPQRAHEEIHGFFFFFEFPLYRWGNYGSKEVGPRAYGEQMHELRSIFHVSYFLCPCECSKRSFYSVNMRSGLEGAKLAVPGSSVITQEMGPQHLWEYAVSFLFISSPVPAIVFILSRMWASGR